MFDVPKYSPPACDGSRGFTPKRSKAERITENAKKRAAVDALKRDAEKKARPNRKSIEQRDRWAFYAIHNFTCSYCGGQAGKKDNDGDTVELAIDHKKSLADGGADDKSNWVCSCVKCNTAKGRRSVKKSKERAA